MLWIRIEEPQLSPVILVGLEIDWIVGCTVVSLPLVRLDRRAGDNAHAVDDPVHEIEQGAV
jgi:hypothetical protein